MKLINIGIIFLIGMALFIPGALFTLIDWPYSSELLIIGSALKLTAAGILIVRIVKRRHNRI